MRTFSRRSLGKLRDVHPYLVSVAVLGLQRSPHDFAITEGLRSISRQEILFAKGRSRTRQSKHLLQSGNFAHAFDIMAVGDIDGDGDVDAQDKSITWDPRLYHEIAGALKAAAAEIGVSIRWGGDFKSWFDGPHFELTGL